MSDQKCRATGCAANVMEGGSYCEAHQETWSPVVLEVKMINHPSKEIQLMAALDTVVRHFCEAENNRVAISNAVEWLAKQWGSPF